MPNYVTNILHVHGDNPEEVFDFIRGEEDGQLFDFNKVIERPECLDISAVSVFAVDPVENERLMRHYCEQNNWGLTEEQLQERIAKDNKQIAIYLKNIEETGYRSWYDWSIDNWGTKWNACDARDNGGDSIIFDTAWATPEPVIKTLSEKFPEYTFEVEYADEDIGCNCGEYTYENGEIIGEVTYSGKHGRKFALGVKNGGEELSAEELADWGMDENYNWIEE